VPQIRPLADTVHSKYWFTYLLTDWLTGVLFAVKRICWRCVCTCTVHVDAELLVWKHLSSSLVTRSTCSHCHAWAFSWWRWVMAEYSCCTSHRRSLDHSTTFRFHTHMFIWWSWSDMYMDMNNITQPSSDHFLTMSLTNFMPLGLPIYHLPRTRVQTWPLRNEVVWTDMTWNQSDGRRSVGSAIRRHHLLLKLCKLPYILAYKSLPRISRTPKKRVPLWSNIVDPRISRRWVLGTCTESSRYTHHAF